MKSSHIPPRARSPPAGEGYSELSPGREPRGLDLRRGLGEHRDQAPKPGGHLAQRGEGEETGRSVLTGPQQGGHAQRQRAVPPAPRRLSSGSRPRPLELGAGVSHW